MALAKSAQSRRIKRQEAEARPPTIPMRVRWTVGSPEKAKPDKVYFLRCEQFVKIGSGRDLQRRVSAHQISVPFKLELLAVLDGDIDLEKVLHRRFLHHWERGEWFRLEGDLADYIASLPAPDFTIRDYNRYARASLARATGAKEMQP